MVTKDPPIEEINYLVGVKVVDIGDIRVARGMSRRHRSSCPHKKLYYDSQERRVWCGDCETNVEPFDAFIKLVENFHLATSQVKKLREEALEARNHNLHLIACKNLEREWRRRKIIPACPHCKNGLLSKDFTPIVYKVSKEIEIQRRKNKEQNQ